MKLKYFLIALFFWQTANTQVAKNNFNKKGKNIMKR